MKLLGRWEKFELLETLEQPPPGPDDFGDDRPEGIRGGTSKRKFIALCVVGGLAVLGCLFLLFGPMILIQGKAAERSMAIHNAKQAGIAVLEFDSDFGVFPSDATVPAVIKATGSTLDFADGSSNAMFRQLIAGGYASGEDIFYCSHPDGTVAPDGVMAGSSALSAGEVGFSYVHGLDLSMNPGKPLLMVPMVAGTADQFWPEKKGWGSPKAFGGKAVVLNLDMSAEAPMIRNSDRKVMIGGGVTLLDPSRFGGWTPDVRHPKF